ncbi:glycosyltransferase family 2 protein [Vibrio sp. TRT 21S02]|uniref:glycosyltransferase family 2 protein n=1 Tax=Vibrio sp. TRT 21S02 TaxID=3418507 RepID=UPI003CEC6E90
MLSQPLVSIITPCYNPGEDILGTISSVLNQTYNNFELLLIDDNSPAEKPLGFKELVLSDKRIRYIERSWNAGPAVTRNRGIHEAKGRFIAFLDADDEWHPDKLQEQVSFMLEHNVELSYTAYEVIDSRGKVLGSRIPPVELSYQDILRSNQIGCLTAVYDANKLGKVYMPNIMKRQDMGLWLKILREGYIAKGICRPLARYRVGNKSVSSNKLTVLKYQWRIYREIEKLPLLKSVKYFSHYAYRGVSRKV